MSNLLAKRVSKTHIFSIVIILFITFWYFGSEQHIAVSTIVNSSFIPCNVCRSTGKANCNLCAGFGSTSAKKPCDKCNGTGIHKFRFKDKPDAPCMACRGTGSEEIRRPCDKCQQKGKQPCIKCSGSGKVTTANNSKQLELGLSYWEKFLVLLHIPIESNPKPQGDAYNGYPIVNGYLASRNIVKVKLLTLGKFELVNGSWIMDSRFELSNSTKKTNEIVIVRFIVKDRKLLQVSSKLDPYVRPDVSSQPASELQE